MKKRSLQSIKSAFNLSYLFLIVLFCFTVTTSLISINYMAKYSFEAGSDDSARVARFVIDVSSEASNDLSINKTQGQTSAEYSFTVSNSDGTNISEVAQKYNVLLEIGENLPEGVSVTLDTDIIPTSDGSGNYTFSHDSFILSTTETVTEHTLKFTVGDSITENIELNGISVYVISEQIE